MHCQKVCLVRRTERRISQKMHFQEFGDSCAQNKTSEISKNAHPGIRGLLCAEQNVGNLKKLHFHKFWHSGAQRGAAFGRPPSVVSFVLALNKAHILALNTAHVLRLNKADALALDKAPVLRLNTKICPVFTANTKEAAFDCESRARFDNKKHIVLA